MPRRNAKAARRTRVDAKAGAKDRRMEIKLFVTSALAAFLVVELLYVSAQYVSLSNSFEASEANSTYLMNSYYILQNNYTSLNASLSRSSIVSPPIRLYVGTSPANATGLIQVPKDQVFCPENATIGTKAAALFAYPYYAELKPGEEFNYTLVYNSSVPRPAEVVVTRPFKLVSYGSGLSAGPMCAGYPNGLYEVSASVRAPESNYTGSVTLFIYRQ